MAASKGHGMTWLHTGWEHHQRPSSHIRHYRTPVPQEKGPSRNSLLQCNKMSVKTKSADEKVRQMRFNYGTNNFEGNFKKGVDITPFVIRVQIKKTHERSSSKSAGKASRRKRDTNERLQFEIESDVNRTQNVDCADKNALPGQEENKIGVRTADIEESENNNDLSGEIIAVEMNAKPEEANYLYLPEISEEERANVQHLLKYLSRRFRDPTKESRKQIPATRPMAAFARPTKGEIALSMWGPVLLAPVSKVIKASSKQTRLDTGSVPEFAGIRNERICNRPISSVSDSVVLTGRKLHGAGRVSGWPECEHGRNESFDQKHHLCHSCRSQHFSNSDTHITRERAKSAVCGDQTRQRKSDRCLPQLLGISTAKLQDGIENNPNLNLQKRNRITPYKMQVNLAQLNSYDYLSTVPPPSLSNSDDEEITT